MSVKSSTILVVGYRSASCLRGRDASARKAIPRMTTCPKKAYAIEGFVFDLLQLTLQLDELLGVVLDVTRILGYVLGHGSEFGHAIQDFAYGFQGSILNL